MTKQIKSHIKLAEIGPDGGSNWLNNLVPYTGNTEAFVWKILKTSFSIYYYKISYEIPV